MCKPTLVFQISKSELEKQREGAKKRQKREGRIEAEWEEGTE